MGVCSGADMAIETALARPVSSLCVINPALSYVKWGDDASASSAEQGPAETADPQTWGATGPLLSRAMARFGRYRRVARWMPTPAWWIVKRWLMTGTPVRTLEHLAESGVNVLLVVGSEESLRIYQGEQHRLSALVAKGDVRFESVPGLDHSLLERSSHELLVDVAPNVRRWPRRPPFRTREGASAPFVIDLPPGNRLGIAHGVDPGRSIDPGPLGWPVTRSETLGGCSRWTRGKGDPT